MRTLVGIGVIVCVAVGNAAAQVEGGAKESAAPSGVAKAHVLKSPTRVAIEPSGMLLVTDYYGECVARYSPASGRVVETVPVTGRPTGVAALGERIYVGNETTGGIEVYHTSGYFIGFLGGPDQFVLDPTELAIDAAANLLFAVDGEAEELKVFTLAGDGQLIGTISGPGLEEFEFQNPTGLALDTVASEVYVADYGEIEEGVNPRVLIFGYDGAYRGSISGEAGTHGYYFSKPQGLAIGETGHVFVVDGWLGRVVVMDRATGEEVTRLGEFGSGRSDLRLPLDPVIYGPDRDLYVTSNLTRRVVRFPEGGQN